MYSAWITIKKGIYEFIEGGIAAVIAWLSGISAEAQVGWIVIAMAAMRMLQNWLKHRT